MHLLPFTAALLVSATAIPCLAQSVVRVYGIIDAAVSRTRMSSGASLQRMEQNGHYPSRQGFEGYEDLGGGMKATFRLEQGFAPDTGATLQGGRAFGRDAYVGLASSSLGELRLGRQYSVMQTALGKYDPDHLSQYSPALAAQISNLEQTTQNNVIKYLSPRLGAFSATLTASLAQDAAVPPGSGPQVVGAGRKKTGYGALLEYSQDALIAGMGYQRNRQTLTAGGGAGQTVMSLGAIYDFGTFDIGALGWRHQNALGDGGTPSTTMWTLGGSWLVAPALRLVLQVGQATDNGRVYATGAAKAKGTSRFLNIGATYEFSTRTAVYARAGRLSDKDNGFNGRASLAASSINDALTLPVNGSMTGVSLGLRHRF